MGNILSTVLITAPLAFMLGWLLAKAVFRHLSLTRSSVSNAAVPDENQARTDANENPDADQDNESMLALRRNEIQLLKEGLAERDHLIQDLNKQLAAKLAPLEDTPANASAQETKLRQTITAMREGLSTRENQLQDLKQRLAQRNEKSVQRFQLWRARFSKAANQIRQQKLIISELREELKSRQPAAATIVSSAETPTTPAVPPHTPVNPVNCNELRALKGVGPAMQIKLNEQGIYNLQQVADLSMPELLQLGESLSLSPQRMQKTNWISQAQSLLNLPAAAAQPAAPAEAAVCS